MRWREGLRATRAKIVGDLAESPIRVAAIALALAIGAAAVTVALCTAAVLSRAADASFAGARPPQVTLRMDRVDVALAQAVAEMPGVRAASPRRRIRGRARVPDGRWMPLWLMILPQPAPSVATVRPVSGRWPTSGLAIERSVVDLLGAVDRLEVRLGGGSATALPVEAVVHDGRQAPAWQDVRIYAYATHPPPGVPPGFDTLHVTVDRDPAAVGARIADRLRAMGHAVHRVEVPPVRHPHADHTRAMTLVLLAFAGVTLLLAGALGAAWTGWLVARQRRIIGILRTLGASRRRVMVIYGASIGLPAGIAVGLGVALGHRIAGSMIGTLAGRLNLLFVDLAPGAGVVLAALAIGLVAPLMALAPIGRALRTPVVDALAEGLAGPGIDLPGRLARRGPGSAMLRLGLSNAVRHPRRALSAIIGLGLGGAMAITAVQVHHGLQVALDDALRARSDVEVRFTGPVPADALRRAVADIEGVDAAEAWPAAPVTLARPDGRTSSGRISLMARPADSRLPRPRLVEGRWPDAGAPCFVATRTLIAAETLAVEPMAVGQSIAVQLGAHTLRGTVVGLVEEIGPPTLYTRPATFAPLAAPGAPLPAGALRITVAPGGDPEAVAARIESIAVDRGWMPGLLMARPTLRRSMMDHFALVLVVLLGFAAGGLVVGGIGLISASGLAVLERRRALGILRALGAGRRALRRLLGIEVGVLAIAAAAVAVLVSLPLTAAIGALVARHALHATLPITPSPVALGGWIALTAALTLLATAVAMRTAGRLAPAELLAYE